MYIGYCVLEMEMMSFKQKIHEISATTLCCATRIANFPHTREERELKTSHSFFSFKGTVILEATTCMKVYISLTDYLILDSLD